MSAVNQLEPIPVVFHSDVGLTPLDPLSITPSSPPESRFRGGNFVFNNAILQRKPDPEHATSLLSAKSRPEVGVVKRKGKIAPPQDSAFQPGPSLAPSRLPRLVGQQIPRRRSATSGSRSPLDFLQAGGP